MKKYIIAIFSVALLIFMILPVSAVCFGSDNLKCAEALKELDLLRGTPNGLELDRPMTRAEASAMLVRFLGAEEKALSGSFSHPFTDVPEWADGYVGWLYRSGLTKGVSNTLYDSERPVTAWQYATFLTRALSDNDTVMPNLITDEEIASIDEEREFLRGDAAVLSLRALGCTYTKNENFRPLADVCIERGLFTAGELANACGDFYASEYTFDNENRIARRMFGIEVAKTEDGGYFVFESIDPIASDGTRFDPFVYKQDGETVTIFAMNPETLEMREIAKREGIKGHFNYKNPFKLGETHFIFETLADEDKTRFLLSKTAR